MSAALKSALTLVALGLLLVVATVWGYGALTEPFPVDEPVAICENATVSTGTEVRRDQVVVSVFNGSGRSGLAGSTSSQLEERGFVTGDVGDAPDSVKKTQIWTSDPKNPAVVLVKRQFKKAKITAGDDLGTGVVIVLGDNFTSLRKKQVESVLAKSDATFCKVTGSE